MANYEELQNTKVTVDLAPDGTAAGSPIDIGFLLSLDNIVDKKRNTKKYNAMNKDDQITSTGRLEIGPFTMSTLYSPEKAEGVNALETAIDDNTEVLITVEMDNSAGTNGTTYSKYCKISSFKVDGDEDGMFKASITAEVIGNPVVTAAS